MKYGNITRAVFLNRPNRFIAEVDIDGHKETVHVKNTGRCKELLIPGCEVWLTAPGTPDRKTKYDLVAVRKGTGILINIDSQASNKVVKEWLETQDYDRVMSEYTYGDSRIDFVVIDGKKKCFIQVAYYLSGQQTIDREFGAFKPLRDASPKYVLSMDRLDFSRDGISHINIVDFLLGKKELMLT